jgi:hypothetical protein
MNSNRSSSRSNLSSDANVRSTRSRNEWIAASNNRFRPRFGTLRLRRFYSMFGMSPALKIALRLYLESKPPSRLRYEPPIFKSASLAMHFNALNPSGRSTLSASLTGTTGSGASTKPFLSIIARVFSPF